MKTLARVDLTEDEWLLLFWAVEKAMGDLTDEARLTECEGLKQRLLELDWLKSP